MLLGIRQESVQMQMVPRGMHLYAVDQVFRHMAGEELLSSGDNSLAMHFIFSSLPLNVESPTKLTPV